MKVLVCGGRTFTQYSLLARTLNEFHKLNQITCIAHGGAKGADTLAGTWATSNKIPLKVYRAEWDVYGRSAGPRRNGVMLKEFRPDVVIAFPGGAGTTDMMRKAFRERIPVIEIQYNQ